MNVPGALLPTFCIFCSKNTYRHCPRSPHGLQSVIIIAIKFPCTGAHWGSIIRKGPSTWVTNTPQSPSSHCRIPRPSRSAQAAANVRVHRPGQQLPSQGARAPPSNCAHRPGHRRRQRPSNNALADVEHGSASVLEWNSNSDSELFNLSSPASAPRSRRRVIAILVVTVQHDALARRLARHAGGGERRALSHVLA